MSKLDVIAYVVRKILDGKTKVAIAEKSLQTSQEDHQKIAERITEQSLRFWGHGLKIAAFSRFQNRSVFKTRSAQSRQNSRRDCTLSDCCLTELNHQNAIVFDVTLSTLILITVAALPWPMFSISSKMGMWDSPWALAIYWANLIVQVNPYKLVITISRLSIDGVLLSGSTSSPKWRGKCQWESGN